jgi:hypothetical protein
MYALEKNLLRDVRQQPADAGKPNRRRRVNPYPWYDICCRTCYSIIATVQIVPDDKPIEPSQAVEYKPQLVPNGRA